MPAVLASEDWPTWLGETDARTEAVKATLKTAEDSKEQEGVQLAKIGIAIQGQLGLGTQPTQEVTHDTAIRALGSRLRRSKKHIIGGGAQNQKTPIDRDDFHSGWDTRSF